jgi:hypothetical protein
MKIAVYTVITKNYDTLLRYNSDYQKEADFFVFTDIFDTQLINEGFYKALEIKFKGQNDRYVARYYKINSHLFFNDYDYVIYQDGTTMMNISPIQLIEKYLTDADLAAFRYPDEDCTYIHAEKCKDAGRFKVQPVDKQMNYYRLDGFPKHFGFSEVRVVLRKNTDQIKRFNELWWEVYKKFLTCDQLCFDYCVWKLGIKRNQIQFFYPWDAGEHEFNTSQQHNFLSPHIYLNED